jgi:FkbM family methyltransferase
MHTNDGHRILLDERELFMTLHILEHGEWETHVRNQLRTLLRPGCIFIDVGANIGLHSIFASSLVGKTGSVYSFEPHPRINSLLRQNLEINGLLDKVTVSSSAISDQTGADVDFEYFDNHPGMSGLKVAQWIIEKNHGSTTNIKVNTTTLDCFVEQNDLSPSLIKIDTEGHEYKVLLGCVKIIKNHPSCVFLMEYEKKMAQAVIGEEVPLLMTQFLTENNISAFRIEQDAIVQLDISRFGDESGGDYILKTS